MRKVSAKLSKLARGLQRLCKRITGANSIAASAAAPWAKSSLTHSNRMDLSLRWSLPNRHFPTIHTLLSEQEESAMLSHSPSSSYPSYRSCRALRPSSSAQRTSASSRPCVIQSSSGSTSRTVSVNSSQSAWSERISGSSTPRCFAL